MRRRDFITLLGSAAVAWPRAAVAQQAMPVIGLLSQRSLAGSVSQMVAFRKGLKEAGFEEGKNVTIEYRWAAGQYDRLPDFAADLVRRKVAVIVAHAGSNAVLAAKAATSIIPIVFVSGGDPVKLGVIASLSRPGGNITGVSVLSDELSSKRLELLIESIPNVTTIGLLVNPTNASSEVYLRQTQEAARALGRPIIVLHASTEDEIEKAFANLVQQRAGGVVISPDAVFNIHSEQLATETARHMIPAMSVSREFPAAGGLMSYGTDFNNANRIVGNYVGRILKGEKPADLPVQQPTKVELVINLKTAKTLGLQIPPKLLALADDVIE